MCGIVVFMNISPQHYLEPDVMLVHKPVGMSSFDVVRKLRTILGIRKIGHAGTLDPLAHGLMIVGINSGTKKMNHYLKLPKTYIADIMIGTSTTTGDLEGDIIDQKTILKNDIKTADIEDALYSMRGKHVLTVPIYSAIKVAGKPLYQYAREGLEPPFIPEKEMNILSIQLLDHYNSHNYDIVTVRIEVSSGTYIRTLGEELGKRLGYPATLKSLYRVKIADYQDLDAYHFTSRKRKTWYGILVSLFAGNNR